MKQQVILEAALALEAASARTKAAEQRAAAAEAAYRVVLAENAENATESAKWKERHERVFEAAEVQLARAEAAEAALLDSSDLCREVAAELVERDAELAEAVRKGEAAEAMLAIVLRDVPDDVTRVLHLIAFELNLPATPENVRTLRRRAEVAEAGLEEAIACAKGAIERANGLAELLGLPAEHKEETTR